MGRFCSQCGSPLKEEAMFCPGCGKALSAKSPAPEPIPAKAPEQIPNNKEADGSRAEPSPSNIDKSTFGGYIKANIAEIKKLLKNPKALFKAILPSIIIAVIWTALAFLEMAFPKNPVIRIFSFFTYAQGGMFGGFFGALGGIVGKALFAYLLCTIVNAVVNKRKLNLKTVFAGFRMNGLSAVGCFLTGAGAAVLLYLAMNITSSAQNAMIGVAGAVMIVLAAGQKNGLLLMAVCGLAQLLTRGKAPSQMSVSRAMSGMATGFIVAVPLSLMRSSWICPIVCFVFLAVGILMLVFGNRGKPKKAIAAMFALTIALSSLTPLIVSAADTTAESGDWVDPRTYWDLTLHSIDTLNINMRNIELKPIAFELNPIRFWPLKSSSYESIEDYTVSSTAWVIELDKAAEDFKLTYTKQTGYINDSYELNINNFKLSLAPDTTPVNESMYESEYVVSGNEKTYNEVHYNMDEYYSESYDGSIYEEKGGLSTLDVYDDMLVLTINYNVEGEFTEITYGLHDTTEEKTACNGEGTIIFQVTRILLSDSIKAGGSSGEDDTTEKHDETRKGVPLKDYDRDGDIDYNDRVIQYELIHDPDYLTRAGTAGTAVIAFISLLSALLGGAAGAAGGAAAGAAAGAAGALRGTAAGSVGAASPYIKFDGAGDIEWTDPATGDMTQYIRQEDGKYKNPLTDQSYTYDELYENAAYRERNAEGFAQDAETAEQNVEEQRAESGGLSDNAKEHAEVLRQLEAIAADREKKINLANKYRLSPDMDDDEFVQTVLAKLAKEQERGKDYAAKGDRMAVYEATGETVVAAADLGMDALATVTGPVGKGINAGYKVAKGAASKGSEEANKTDGNVTTGIMQGAIEGSIDAAYDYMGGGAKAAGTVVGESVKGGLDSYIKGEDVTEGMVSGAKKGALNAAIDAGTDAVGGQIKKASKPGGSDAGLTDAINSASSEDTAKKIASANKSFSQTVDVGTNVTDNVAKKVAESAMKDEKK